MWVVIGIIGGISAGTLLGFVIATLIQKSNLIKTESTLKAKIGSLEQSNSESLKRHSEELERIKKEQDVELKSFKLEIEKEVKENLTNKFKAKEETLNQLESKIRKREESLDTRSRNLDNRDKNLARKETNIEKTEKDLELEKQKLVEYEKEIELKNQKILQELERISGFTSDMAKDILFKQIEEDVKHESAKKVQKIITDAQENAEKEAKHIIGLAIQRFAGEYVSEKTVSVVHLANDDIKGRIIGREGRNIRAFEAATGVDLIIDETPEAVVLSSFNPVRREVARLSLERLIEDGRIHPARIEEIVQKTENDVNEIIMKAGKDALMELNLPLNMHNEMIKLVGSLKYRTSYGQNILQHSIEVGFFCGMLADELGIDSKNARRAGLLHDVGKAIDHEIEGSHAIIGANMAKKYGEPADVVNAIASHHNDVPPETILAFLVDAADALSGARPGARRETMEAFIRRLQDIEAICKSFEGVQKSFAIQAGREVRVIVENEKVNDEEALVLSRDLAKRIEQEVTYPGQIKIVVIREKRIIAYAS